MRPKIKTYRDGDPYKFAHIKRDGIWLSLIDSRAFTRHPIPEKGDITLKLVDHSVFQRFLSRNRNHTLYCELFAPGRRASQVKSLLAKGKVDQLVIEAFASPSLPEDAHLADVETLSQELGVPFAAWHYEEWPDWSAQPDAEGLVYKDGNLLNWAKHKDIRTADLVVTGTIDGNGAMIGLVGSLVLATGDGHAAGSCSGMTMNERCDMTMAGNNIIGRVAEVAYQYVGDKGGLRHPRFVRWRDDKSSADATRKEDL